MFKIGRTMTIAKEKFFTLLKVLYFVWVNFSYSPSKETENAQKYKQALHQYKLLIPDINPVIYCDAF